jgi:hypothetical protein
MKHFYAHILNIEPVSYSISLSRGIIGHEALAAFYEALQAGQDTDTAAAMMHSVVDKYFIETFKKPSYSGKDDSLKMLNELKTLLSRYVEFQRDDEWEILEVETTHVLPMFDSYGYGMRLDLLVRYTKGPYSGGIAIVDHKFVYDFPGLDTIAINSQIPKYLATVRNETGLVIKHGVLNCIRHRLKKGAMLDEELFRREVIKPSTKRIRNIMREQMQVSERILERRAMPVEEAKSSAVRVLNQMLCKNCSFLNLCMTDLEGENTDLMLKTEFQHNSYGYNKAAVGDE